MKQLFPEKFTSAPQQLKVERRIRASIEDIWELVAHHQGMTQWIPMIKHVELISPNEKGEWGEGCERHCSFGPDLLEETIVHWDPPYGYAYRIADMHLLKDHLGYIKLLEKLDGTHVTWTQYYSPNGNATKSWLTKNIMLPYVMKRALKNLNKRVTKKEII